MTHPTALPVHAAIALLLQVLPHALAHEDGVEAMAMTQTHGHAAGMGGMAMDMPLPMVKTPSNLTAEPTYFSHPQYSGILFTHIILMMLAWVVVLPPAVMFSISHSRLRVPSQILFLGLNVIGVLASCVYNHGTPDLYENNAHHRLGWVVTWAAIAWTAFGVLTRLVKSGSAESPRPSIQVVSQQAMAEYQRSQGFDPFRWSQDSGHGTDRNTASLASNSRSNSWDTHNSDMPKAQKPGHEREEVGRDDTHDEEEEEKQGLLQNGQIDRFLIRNTGAISHAVISKTIRFCNVFLERSMIPLAFLALITGLVTYSGIGKGHHVFNVLAHLIKGGIFFGYGILTFGRWLGCFADVGWAWNLKPGPEMVGRFRGRVPSAEFVESAVICFYGASNVFLEHLSGWGAAWTAMDFEHISITIMFFGGGLLGMLIESPRVRNILIRAIASTDVYTHDDAMKLQRPASYVHSLNPVPSLVILLLGIMMSSHTQHSLIAGQIHKQWGLLFAGFALARILTYTILWLKPPTSYLPTRPPTEILASFCLVSGGLIFMASNADTVTALEDYNLDSMFTFTVMMGWTCLIMSWTLIVVAVKGWATRRARRAVEPMAQTETA